MESKTHISTRNLTVWYGKHQALNNITLDIPDKKITAIIGPSGCGKTTLIKTFNRLIDIQDNVKVSGQVVVDGKDIYNPKVEVTHLRKKMGLLSQKPQVLPMSIYENVAYGPKVHGVKGKMLLDQIERIEYSCPFREFCDALSRLKTGKELDLVVEYYLRVAGLWEEVKDRLHTPAAKLSIGQQQRLCLARGLAVEPEIILADEPTSALDPISAERIENRLQIIKSHYTIVMVTHSLSQAKRIADYLIFLYMGNLIEHGSAEVVFHKPKYAKTQNYLNGKLIEEIRVDQELNLKGTICPNNFVKTKLALENIKRGKILKIIVDYEPAVEEVPKALEYEGHKILEIKRLNGRDWEIIIQKDTEN